MFIKITDSREEEDKYINIFKICEIKRNMVCIDGLANIKGEQGTAIKYILGSTSCNILTNEKIDSFMRRLNREKKEAIKTLSRFELMDL